MLTRRSQALRAAPATIPLARERLKPLRCPLDDEILVAEISGELPPGVAATVRAHVAACPTCGPRARSIAAPYKLVARLTADQPVPVPDLRDRVRIRVATRPLGRSQRRFVAFTGRTVLVTGILVAVVVALAGVLAHYVVRPQAVPVNGALANTLRHVPAAGQGGSLVAETDVLVPVSNGSGPVWMADEVIVADQRTGQVTHTLPGQTVNAVTATDESLPTAIALSPDGRQLVEISAPSDHGGQALISFDVKTGEPQFVAPLFAEGGAPLPAGTRATSLVISPTKPEMYVGLTDSSRAANGLRILVADLATGATLRTMPSNFSQRPTLAAISSDQAIGVPAALDASAMTATQTLGGTLAISPDGTQLFDVLDLADAQSGHYGILREMAVLDASLTHELAFPGSFAVGALASSPSGYLPQVYLARPSPGASVSVVSLGAQGMSLLATVTLGGPEARDGVTYADSITMSPSLDGAELIVAQDAAASDHSINGHDVWLIDTAHAALMTRRTDSLAVAGMLTNGSGGTDASPFILRGGQVWVLGADLAGAPTAWLGLTNNRNVVRLIGTVLV
ncbi:MAG TPA: hypothetical protein VF807_15630 [Ktedonobacterales bacterium]